MVLGKVLLFLHNNRQKKVWWKEAWSMQMHGSFWPHSEAESCWRKNESGSFPTYPFPNPQLSTLFTNQNSSMRNWPSPHSQIFHLYNRVNNAYLMLLTWGLESSVSKAPHGNRAAGCFFFLLLASEFNSHNFCLGTHEIGGKTATAPGTEGRL